MSCSTDSVTPTGFWGIAAGDPDRPAVIDPTGRVTTYGELGSRVTRLAHGLRAHGLLPGGAVAGLLRNGRAHVEMVLATNLVGLYYVPINWHLTPAEAAYIIADCEAGLVLAESDAADALRSSGVDLPPARFVVGERVPGWSPYDTLRDGVPDGPPADRTAGDVMGYTSGTTGRPKGVRRPLNGLDPMTQNPAVGLLPRFGLDPTGTGVHLVCSPLYHAAPNVFAHAFLHAGHTLVIEDRFDPATVLRDIETHRVTSTHMVPTHLHRLLRLPEEVRRAADLSSLAFVAHSGAPCPAAVKRATIEWFGPILWEYLASTEGLVSVVGAQEWLEHPGTVGRPIAGVRIVDAHEIDVGVGEVGTIFFPPKGPTEYHNDPEKTAASSLDGLFTAGDLGHIDADGYLYVADRREDLIVSGGVNIYPAEIEQHLLGHAAIEDVAVVGMPDAEWGQRVVAFVQPRHPGNAPAALVTDLESWCGVGLTSFKRPREIRVVDRLPRSEAGKLLRRALRESS